MQSLRLDLGENSKPMAKNLSCKKRFAGREAELTEKIKLLGTDPVALEEGVNFVSFHKYAEDVLGLQSPAYTTQSSLKSAKELACYLVAALSERDQKQKAEIARLRQENMELRDMEAKKEATAKLQLMQLLDQVEN